MSHSDDALNVCALNEALRLQRINSIGRITARVDTEAHAFAIEALYIKFVFGLNGLTNIQPGNHTEYFRARNDWQKRLGFDFPFVINPGERVDRSEKLDLMIGEGLDLPLMEIKNSFPKLSFDPPKVLDASELGIEAEVGNTGCQSGARIKIFIRRKKIRLNYDGGKSRSENGLLSISLSWGRIR